MSDFDDEPDVPRTSKQAKMLGMGVDRTLGGPKSSGGGAGGSVSHRGAGAGAPAAPPSGGGGGDMNGTFVEGWNGWGAKLNNGENHGVPKSPRVEAGNGVGGGGGGAAPWGNAAPLDVRSLPCLYSCRTLADAVFSTFP